MADVNLSYEPIYSEKKRNALIKKETKRLEKLFENLQTSKLKVANNLIQDAAFMSVQLEELKKIINRDGVVEKYQNGESQMGLKKSAASEVYDKMINTYSKVVKQLCDLVPDIVVFHPEDEEDEDPAKELMRFVEKLKK